MSKTEEIVEELNRTKKDYVEKCKLVVNQLFELVFKDHPAITKLNWKQYAPSFNDGDPCVFRVRKLYLELSDAEDSERDYWEFEESNPSLYADVKSLHSFMQNNTDIMEEIFGESSNITAYPDGNFDQESYNDY